MIRMSALRHAPVICGQRNIGLVQAISLDAAQKRVSALIVACGLRGKRMALPQDVYAIARGFILVGRVRPFRREMETQAAAFIRDSTGLLAGRVVDYAIDEDALTVMAIETIAGYWPPERRMRTWVYRYARAGNAAELIVPVCLGRERINYGEGIESCESPR